MILRFTPLLKDSLIIMFCAVTSAYRRIYIIMLS